MDLFEDEELLQSHQRERLCKEVSSRFGKLNVSKEMEINRTQFIKGVWILSQVMLSDVDETDLLTACSQLYTTQKEEWKIPKQVSRSVMELISQITHLMSPEFGDLEFDLTLDDKVTLESEAHEVEMESDKSLDENEDSEDFDGSGDEQDELVMKEDVDMWWSAVDVASKEDLDTLKSKSKKSYKSLAKLLGEDLDYDTLEEDLEGEFMKLDGEYGADGDGDMNNEESIDKALTFALGGLQALSKAPTGKVHADAIDKATHRMMMSDLGMSDEEEIDVDLLKLQLNDTKEVYHDIREPIEPEENTFVHEEESEEEIEYEYVDEDGNPVEAPESDGEYEYVYEDVSGEEENVQELDTVLVEGGFDYYGIESDSDAELDGEIENQLNDITFGDDDLDVTSSQPSSSWADLLADM